MKFFTPELIARLNTEDEQQWNEQERLWEAASERYVAHLEALRPLFPPGLQQLDSRYYLHDAVVFGMGQRKNEFVILLQLDTPPRSLLTLTYDLVDGVTIAKDLLPPGLATPPYQAIWSYDEIEQAPGTPPTWRQSILLSTGWEVQLYFRDVAVQEAQAIFPAAGKTPTVLPQSA